MAFDPSQPFEVVGDSGGGGTAIADFDPSKPFELVTPPNAEKKKQFDPSQPFETIAPSEEIKAAPTVFGELTAGRFKSAAFLAKDAVSQALRITQPTRPGTSLLGTTEQLPSDPNDSYAARAAKATVNVGNRLMAGLTTPEMMPLWVLGGAPGIGRVLTGAFAGDIIANIPETWKRIQETQKTEHWSQDRMETGLDTVLQAVMLHGLAQHALRQSNVNRQLETSNIPKGGDINATGTEPISQGAGGGAQIGGPTDATGATEGPRGPLSLESRLGSGETSAGEGPPTFGPTLEAGAQAGGQIQSGLGSGPQGDRPGGPGAPVPEPAGGSAESGSATGGVTEQLASVQSTGEVQGLDPAYSDIHAAAEKAAYNDNIFQDSSRTTAGPGQPGSIIRKQWDLAYRVAEQRAFERLRQQQYAAQSPSYFGNEPAALPTRRFVWPGHESLVSQDVATKKWRVTEFLVTNDGSLKPLRHDIFDTYDAAVKDQTINGNRKEAPIQGAAFAQKAGFKVEGTASTPDVIPQLRPSEKGTADLFQGADQPFNLAGEQGIDYGARQLGEEAAARALQASSARQDQLQGRLFTPEQQAEANYRAEMQAELDAPQGGQRAELKDAIIRAGGLPSRQSPHRTAEIHDLEQTILDPNRTEKIPPNRMFRKDAPPLDELATRLRDQGFDLAGPNQLYDLLDQRFRTGNPIYGIPERADIEDEQRSVPLYFGPGAADVGERLNVGSQVKQLTETVSNVLRTARPAPMASRFRRTIEAAGGKVVTGRETLGRAADTARATWLTIKNGYLRPPVEGEFKDAVKDWQGADQRTSFEVRKFVQKLRSEIRDPLVRDAITNYIQADGDLNLLRKRADASNIKYRPGYEAAMHLNDGQSALAANVRQYFDAMLQDGMNAGIVEHGLDNYISQIWKRPNKFTQALQADLQTGKLQTNFKFARKRIFDSFFDGERAGYAPASKDVSALVAAYDIAFNRSLAARGFVKSLRESKSPAGEPVVRFSGMSQPIPAGAVPPEAYLIRSRALPESAVTKDGRKYAIVDHPALRGWKMVIQGETEAPAYHQVDMLVHPDYAPQLRNILGRSWFRQNPITSTLLKAGAIAKQTKLSLSLFHLDQEGLHGLFHRVNPANLEQINFDHPAQALLVRNGLQVADYSAMELFAEGLRGGGLVSKIPVLGKLQNNFNEFLFKDYIPRLKMTMAMHAFERNVKRYPNLSPDIIAELTARQGNAAFGELNYKLMARSPTMQDFLRLTVLAPDFLEARSRFVGQALKPYGAEQRAALLLGGAVMYIGGRALNQWLDNDPHWDKPFSVIYNGREYRLRTVMGDAYEVFTDPRRFFYNRFSPWLKLGYTVGSGRDYRGIRLTNLEQVKDALSWLVPIPLGGNEPASVGQRFLGSAGVSNKPAPTAIDEVYKAASDFKSRQTDPKIQAEVRRSFQETQVQSDYAKLNRALLDRDRERAVAELVSLMKEKGKDPAQLAKYYSNLPARPFTDSRALEAKFLARMTPVERARYHSAVNERINLARTFFSLLPIALRQKRQNR